ncbi:MAG: Eco57I restriction-modification methylase domain-containing protein [Rikenellaceae bacterium]
MLGHIFENLLEDNKDKGAFYTPKEIVQYMCRQSLIEYLQSKLGKNTALESFVNQHDTSAKFIIENAAEIENLLDNIKICDPAIGSGAFPMGILNEIFHCKMALDLTLNRAEVKKNIIQKSIYGVDIEQGAVDIARLRFWLSLVVEENEPQPLPNLDYKIMCGNSLLSRYALDTPIDEVFAEYNRKNKTNFTLEDYKALVSGYTTTSNKSQKANFRTKIEEIKSAFKTSLNDKDKLKRMKLQGKINALRADNLFGSATKAELKEAKELEKKLKTMLQNESDIQNNHLYKDAFEWRFEFPALLSDDGAFVGFDVVIGNPPYFIYQGNNAGELSALKCQREFDIAFGGKLNAYKLFLAKALKCLTKTDGIITYIFQNSFLADKQAEQLRKYTIDNAQIVVIDSYPERDSKRKRVFESVKMSVCTIVIRNTHSLEPFTVNVWKDKNKENGITSLFTKHIIKAIDPNAYTIPRIENKDIQTIIKVKQQSSNVKLKCFEGELNMTFHKEYFNFNINNPLILKGASIQRYYFTKEMSQGTVEYLEEKSYLMKYQKSGKSNHHNSERIAMQGMTGANDHTRLVMTYIPKDIYLANSCNYLLPSDDYDIKYVLALLNSKLLNWYFRCFSTNSNVNGYEVDDLPIKLVEIDVQQLFASIVDEILRIKGSDYKADTLELEARIDKMVYKLYELTPREIELVEGR